MVPSEPGDDHQRQAFDDLLDGAEHVTGDATDLADRQPHHTARPEQCSGDERAGPPPGDGADEAEPADKPERGRYWAKRSAGVGPEPAGRGRGSDGQHTDGRRATDRVGSHQSCEGGGR